MNGLERIYSSFLYNYYSYYALLTVAKLKFDKNACGKENFNP